MNRFLDFICSVILKFKAMRNTLKTGKRYNNIPSPRFSFFCVLLSSAFRFQLQNQLHLAQIFQKLHLGVLKVSAVVNDYMSILF